MALLANIFCIISSSTKSYKMDAIIILNLKYDKTEVK